MTTIKHYAYDGMMLAGLAGAAVASMFVAKGAADAFVYLGALLMR